MALAEAGGGANGVGVLVGASGDVQVGHPRACLLRLSRHICKMTTSPSNHNRARLGGHDRPGWSDERAAENQTMTSHVQRSATFRLIKANHV